MPGHDILFFGAVDWFGHRKLPAHHVAALLARRNRVFYVDNIGGDRPLTLKDAPRALRKLRQMARGERRIPSAGTPAEVVVHQPVAIPFSAAPAVMEPLNATLLARGVLRLMRRHGIERPVLWTRLPSAVMWRALRRIPHSLLVYQSVDHYPYSPAFSDHVRPRLAWAEERICRSADLVFTSARGLYDLKRAVNPNTHLFVNGVHTEPFAREGEGVARLREHPRPVVGFAGGLGAWIDFAMLRRAAEATPEWSWVLLGAVSPGVDVQGLDRVPNVHFMGEVAHGDLPAWFRSFDAGVIPYRVTEFTRFTFPSKLAEYLAAGLPVVSTPLPELQPYGEVVRFADTAEALVAALRQGLSAPDPEAAVRERRRVAGTLAWPEIVDAMERRIDEAVERRRRGEPADGRAAALAEGA